MKTKPIKKRGRTYWCNNGCGKKVTVFKRNKDQTYTYKCSKCGTLFNKISIGNTKPIVFKLKKIR